MSEDEIKRLNRKIYQLQKSLVVADNAIVTLKHLSSEQSRQIEQLLASDLEKSKPKHRHSEPHPFLAEGKAFKF